MELTSYISRYIFFQLQAVIECFFNLIPSDCEDKKSEEFCAAADCSDKKMAKKCMKSCGLCEAHDHGDDHDHEEDHQEEHEDWHEDEHEGKHQHED